MTNPKRSGLLPWPGEWLYQIWFQKPREDDGFTQKISLGWSRSCDQLLDHHAFGPTVIGDGYKMR